MLTEEIRALDSAFKDLVKRRRGTMVRRGGAGSRDFEISFPYPGHEVLVGVESGWTVDDALFLFIRHSKAPKQVVDAHPFLPPRPAGVPEVAGRPELEEAPGKKSPGGRAGEQGTATPSAPSGTGRPARPSVPGFSVSLRELTLPERLFHKMVGRQVHADPRRPGWFHVELDHGEQMPAALDPDLRDPLSSLVNVRPQGHLSVAMTGNFFRVRRSPLLFEIEEIDHFVTRCLEVFQAGLSLTPPELDTAGVYLVEMLYEAGRGARCGVCGEEAAARRVLCAKCATPHHSECWEYQGGCSIFGCGSTRRSSESA